MTNVRYRGLQEIRNALNWNWWNAYLSNHGLSIVKLSHAIDFNYKTIRYTTMRISICFALCHYITNAIDIFESWRVFGCKIIRRERWWQITRTKHDQRDKTHVTTGLITQNKLLIDS